MTRTVETSRRLALHRRARALLWVTGGGVLLALPFIVTLILDTVARLFKASFALPLWVYGMALGLTLVITLRALYLWQRADDAEQAAKTEAIAARLYPLLQQRGWRMEFNRSDRRTGGTDLLLRSPMGTAYAIDLVPLRGEIYISQGQLYRRINRVERLLDVQLLHRTQQRMAQLQQRRQLTLQCQPVLVLTQARVMLHTNPVQGIFLLDLSQLLPFLLTQG